MKSRDLHGLVLGVFLTSVAVLLDSIHKDLVTYSPDGFSRCARFQVCFILVAGRCPKLLAYLLPDRMGNCTLLAQQHRHNYTRFSTLPYSIQPDRQRLLYRTPCSTP
jgi:hypothetical protein